MSKPKKKPARVLAKAQRSKLPKSKSSSARAAVATVLVMRTCAPDMSSHSGFVWPERGPVSCKDWNPRAHCGNGLHGLLWGEGDSSLLNWQPEAKWLVVEVPADSIINLDGKVKFPSGTVLYCGDMVGAAGMIAVRAPAGSKIVGGTATAGARGTATAGARGTATAGYAGTATAGYAGTATAGDAGTATAGDAGTATAGEGGVITICFYDATGKWRRLIGQIGENELEPNIAYIVDGGKFARKDAAK